MGIAAPVLPPAVLLYPPVPIDQGAPAAIPLEAYWYYCQESATYYPYVQQCPSPWQRVVPAPPPPH